MSSKSVLQECHVRVEGQVRVSYKSALKECQVRVAKEEVLSKSVLQECQVRVWEKKCQARGSYKSVK